VNDQSTFYPALFDFFPEPVIAITSEGVSYFNPSAARLFDTLAANGPLPAELAAILPADGLNCSVAAPDYVISGRHYQVAANPTPDGVLIVFRAVGDSFPLPARLLEVFSSRLRTKLNALLSATSLLSPAIEATKQPEYIKYLSIINQYHYRLLRDLGSLAEAIELASAQEDGHPLENVDLAAVCRNIAESADTLARISGRSVRFSCAEERLIAAFRSGRIEQLLLNLISNALKFTPFGGHVLITLSVENDLALLTVSDQGEGLDAGEMATVFSNFEAALEPVAKPKGLGLGLSLVRQIAVQHGGSVMLESRPEKGTKVIVSLPLTPLDDAVEDTCRPPVDFTGGFPNILVELSDALPPEAFRPQNLE